ncbi:MAG: sigma-70 family RNA polymerase sigma factor [Planctomycetota bacterium]
MTRDSSTLLERLRSKDRDVRQAAESELFQTFAPRIRAVLSRIVGSGPELDDAMQESFVDVFRGLPSFQGRSGLGTWIYRVALRRGWKCSAREHHKRSWQVTAEALPEPETRMPPAEALEAKELAQRFEVALRRLDFDQRNVLALSASRDLSPQEIAETLGVPVGTVHSRLSRARTRLKQLLDVGEE